MVAKKTKKNVKPKKITSKKSTKKNTKPKGKSSKNAELLEDDDAGIVILDEDIKVDKDAELEARKAYLEEARSQEASD